MANDRFFVRCTVCGDYLFLGKYYPSTGAYFNCDANVSAMKTFVESHLNNCQTLGFDFKGPLCLVFDSEQTLCDAGGVLGGSGNTRVDFYERKLFG